MIAKGKLFVSREKLQELFSLPEDVEVLGIRPKGHEDGFEFLLVSANETIATRNVTMGEMRRVTVEQLEDYKNGIVGGGTITLGANGGFISESMLDKLTITPNEHVVRFDDIVKAINNASESFNDKTVKIDLSSIVVNQEVDVKQIFDNVVKSLDKMNKIEGNR